MNTLSATGTLGADLLAHPHKLERLQTEVTQTYHRVCARFEKCRDPHSMWAALKQETALARVRPTSWRVPADDIPLVIRQWEAAERALVLFSELATMPAADAAALLDMHMQMAVAPAGRAVAARYPAIAAWANARDTAHGAAAAADAAQRAAAAAAELAARPAGILARLRGRGVTVGLDAKSNITASAPNGLTAAEVAELRAHKPAIAALLRAETALQMVVV